MSALAYRSVAVQPPADSDLRQLQRVAQARNQQEGLTGVLLYDRQTFFQMLEGPSDGLRRVWKSIVHDARHRDIEVLRDEPVSYRSFDGWDLRLLQGSPGSIDQAVAALDTSRVSLRHVFVKPPPVLALSLPEVFSTIVLPRLSAAIAQLPALAVKRASSPLNWHAKKGSGGRLARALLSPSERDSHRYVDSLLAQGAGFNAMYQEVFEPAQLRLGEMRDREQCDDFHLTMGLLRLNIEIMRVNSILPAEHQCTPDRSVLLCAPSTESHSGGLWMSSEAFKRRGWDVGFEPRTDDSRLDELLQARWFDVLKLSTSGALHRDGDLHSLRATITSARSASQNPALIVMVDGRTFVDRPKTVLAVNADAAGGSAIEGPLVAERLVTMSRAVTPLCQVSVG